VSDTEDDMAAGAQLYEAFLEKQMSYSKGGFMKIAEVLKLQDQMPVSEPVMGRIKNYLDRKKGVSTHGKNWSNQGIFLKDDTSEILVMCWNRPEMSGLKDQVVTIGAKKTDKGWIGCKVKLYQGKKNIELADSGRFEIRKSGDQPESYPKGNPAEQESMWTPPPSSSEPISLWVCLEAVKVIHPVIKELEPDDAIARSTTLNTFIMAIKDNKIKFDIPEPPAQEEKPEDDHMGEPPLDEDPGLPPDDPTVESDDLIPF